MADLAEPPLHRNPYKRSPKSTLLVAALWPIIRVRRFFTDLVIFQIRSAVAETLAPSCILLLDYTCYHFSIERQGFSFLTVLLFLSLIPVVEIVFHLGKGILISLFGSKSPFGNYTWVVRRSKFPPIATRIMAFDTSMRAS